MSSRVSAKQRRTVYAQANGYCEYCYCHADFATESFSVEHIVPIARGGSNALTNLALACQGCNSHKYTKIDAPDPADGHPAALYNPRRQRWLTHFQWSDDFLEIIGTTPTGRATVKALKMNRQNVINLRRAMYALGVHPPVIGHVDY